MCPCRSQTHHQRLLHTKTNTEAEDVSLESENVYDTQSTYDEQSRSAFVRVRVRVTELLCKINELHMYCFVRRVRLILFCELDAVYNYRDSILPAQYVSRSEAKSQKGPFHFLA